MNVEKNENKIAARSIMGFAATIMACGLLFGCAKSGEDNATTATPAETSTKVATVKAQPTVQIAGTWLGEATMDENLLQAKLDQLTPEYQQSTLAKARSFLTTMMAIDFGNEGVVESEVEIVSLDGQTMRDGSKGAWRVIGEKENGVLVETQENLSDGTVTTNQAFYQFADADHVFLVVPVCEELENCGAKMVFTRQAMPSENVAQGSQGTAKR